MDYSKKNNVNTIISHKEERNNENRCSKNKSEFSKFFRQHLKDRRKGRKTTRDIANMLGISYEQFRKIINMQKPTKKRDCIIAICAMLQVDPDEANKALALYNYMPTFDVKYNARDKELVKILDVQGMPDQFLKLDQINNRLIRNGFEPLDIIDHRTRNKKPKKIYPYKIIDKKAYCVMDYSGDDPYDSLLTKYSLDNRVFFAEMVLADEKKGKNYRLVYDSNNQSIIEIYDKNNSRLEELPDYQRNNEFYEYVLELKSMYRYEQKKVFDYINDTRNYNGRMAARIIDNEYYAFYEKYNYDVPEAGEYYLMEYYKGRFILKVLHQSGFLKCYLREEEYMKYFDSHMIDIYEVYSSLKSIHVLNKAEASEGIKRLRIKAYNEMKNEIANMTKDIKDKKIFILHPEYIFDPIWEIYKYYEVPNITIEGDAVVYSTPDVTVNIREGNPYVLSCDDLIEGFSLGLDTLEDIANAKVKYGTLYDAIPEL